MKSKIGVGIIGVSAERGWAAMAHIPALRALDAFELTAISARHQSSARRAAELFGVDRAYADHHDLIACPAVDLVVITVKTPHHHELVTAALSYGKPVYCEWPLGNGLAEAAEMHSFAKQRGIPTIIGLQARFSPIIQQVRKLVSEGEIGDILSTSLIGAGGSWGDVTELANAYSADRRNGATLLSIPFGHTIDALCYCLGDFNHVTAELLQRRQDIKVAETGERIPLTSPDQVIVSGQLASGTAVSAHYRGGITRATNFLWEINGTWGDLQIRGESGHAQLSELRLFGAYGDKTDMEELSLPMERGGVDLSSYPGNIARIYKQVANDWDSGEFDVPDFQDALNRHRMLDAVELAATTGKRQEI